MEARLGVVRDKMRGRLEGGCLGNAEAINYTEAYLEEEGVLPQGQHNRLSGAGDAIIEVYIAIRKSLHAEQIEGISGKYVCIPGVALSEKQQHKVDKYNELIALTREHMDQYMSGRKISKREYLKEAERFIENSPGFQKEDPLIAISVDIAYASMEGLDLPNVPEKKEFVPGLEEALKKL